MEKNRNRRLAVWSSLYVGVVVILTAVLGVLQYRWIGEVSLAERERLKAGLQASLHRLSQDFNTEITGLCAALLAGAPSGTESDREKAYAVNYSQWRDSSRHARLFRGMALASAHGGAIQLKRFDAGKGAFFPGEWPESWSSLRDRMASRLSGQPPEPRQPFGQISEEILALIELPRIGFPGGFGLPAVRDQGGERGRSSKGGLRDRRAPPPRMRDGPPEQGDRPPDFRSWQEMERLIVEIDVDYARDTLLPELLQRHLGGGRLDYQVEIVARRDPSRVVYLSEKDPKRRIGTGADASVPLFDVQFDQILRRLAPSGMRDLRRDPGVGPFPGAVMPERGRWLLSVRHQAGSLEAVVEKARVRNLAVIAGILGLMVAAAAALVRFTRRAQRLAQLQVDFVTGVSHELRTPLSVIRTAAHNLRGGVVTGTRQVQRYGILIVEETERLTAIVEQVLHFARAKAGRPIGARERMAVEALADEALAATSSVRNEAGCVTEKKIEPDLPPILADPISLNHALQNLLTNAAKYGSAGGWIGLSAARGTNGSEGMVEIRVSDHGTGVPADELGQIFDPFYRGKRAIENQIHGTGLGLDLVKRIVEAHGGTVTVQSEFGKGTEFLLRIPAAPPDQTDERSDSTDRR